MIITVAANKGGVAKTTSAVAIAHQLAQAGKKVLLVDLDTTGSVCLSLGIQPSDGVFRLFTGSFDTEDCVEARNNLYVVPGDSRSKMVDLLIRDTGEYYQAQKRLWDFTYPFEVVVFDTKDGLKLQELAISLADVVLVPTVPEALAADAVYEIDAMLNVMHGAGLFHGKMYVLPTKVGLYKEHDAILAALRDSFGASVLPVVPNRIGVAVLAAQGKTLFEGFYAYIEPVREAYRLVILEITE